MRKVQSKALSPAGIDVDVNKHTLLIRYKTTVVYVLEDGQTESEISYSIKPLPLEQFELEDVDELADELLRRTPLLDSRKKDSLVKCLKQLCGRDEDNLGAEADISHLNKYIEALYEELNVKIDATRKIAMLAKEQKYEQQISQNEVLMSALARTLREDGLKNMQLGQNIMEIFYELSFREAFGQVLLTHKAPDSLIKMIELENKRYTVMYKELCDKKKRLSAEQMSKSSGEKELEELKEKKAMYIEEHENFKQLTANQDELLLGAINTLINLIEISSKLSGKTNLFISLDKLVMMLAECIKRKPINMNLLTITVQVMQKISTLPNGLEAIQKAEILNALMKIVAEDNANQVDAVLKLLYNMTFDPHLLEELKEKDFLPAIMRQFEALTQRFLNKYRAEFAETDDFPTKIGKIAKNASKHTNDAESQRMSDQLKLYTNIASELGCLFPDELLINLTGMVCGLKQPPEEILINLATLSQDPEVALRIAESGLLDALTTEFEATKNENLVKIFSNVTAAMPLEVPDPQISGEPTSKEEQRDEKQRFMVDQISRMANIALETGNDKLQSEAIAMMAHAPPKMIEKEEAELISKLALEKMALSPGSDISGKMNAVSVINNFMKKQQTVEMLADERYLKDLPQLLLDNLSETQNAKGESGFDANIGQFGLEYDKMEMDYAIETLMCILRACTYKVIRRKFVQLDGFFTMIVRFLYNTSKKQTTSDQSEPSTSQTRNERSEEATPSEVTSQARGRASKMMNRGKKEVVNEGTVFRSMLETPELRAAEILESIADAILDIIMFTEAETADKIRMLKYERYNWEFSALKV